VSKGKRARFRLDWRREFLARAVLEALEDSWGGRTAVVPPAERGPQMGLSDSGQKMRDSRWQQGLNADFAK